MTRNPLHDDPDGSWRDEAACLDHPAEWFTGPHEPGDTRRALDVCNTCPVKQPCLETALRIEVSADLGIWGGTTPTGRRRIRRERGSAHSVSELRTRALAAPPLADGPSVRTGELELFQDEYGDHIDGTGRVVIFEIHGEPPYMLMIDGQPRARTTSFDDALGLAARFIAAGRRALHQGALRTPAPPDTRRTAAAQRRL